MRVPFRSAAHQDTQWHISTDKVDVCIEKKYIETFQQKFNHKILDHILRLGNSLLCGRNLCVKTLSSQDPSTLSRS